MTLWIVLTAVVAAGGIGTAAIAVLAELRPRPRAARAELSAGIDRIDLALLTGGPVRGVDTYVVDFIERGLVRVHDGRLSVDAEVDRMLDTPMNAAEYRPSWTLEEAIVLSTIRDRGGGGLDALRRNILGGDLSRRLRGLARRGLLVTRTQRQWSAMIVAGPILIGLFACFAGLLYSGDLDETELPAAIVIGASLPVTIAAALLWNRRPGYSGRDPRSRRGRDVSALSAPVATATQADRIAHGGFAEMSDDTLRRVLQADGVDSRWNLRRRAGNDLNALLVVQSLDASGGGGDSGGGE